MNLNHEEYQYLNLINNILNNGSWEETRNGRTKSIFGSMMRFSLQNNKIPILTTKKTAWKTCLKELLWFIRGQTDNKILKEQGVHIWDANGSREFLDSRGLTEYEVDELGPCFVKGTKVLTENGYKNIEDIVIDENVYTHNGNFLPVVETTKNPYIGKIFKVRPWYIPFSIDCTSEHPFYARKFFIKNRIKINGVEKRNYVFADKPEFIRAKDLVKGKYLLGMKIEEKEIVPEFMLNGVMTKLDNPKFWWMMGLFVGDGWLVGEKVGNYERNRIYFVIANNQIEEYLPTLLSVIPSLTTNCHYNGCVSYYATNHEVANILMLFGKYAKYKKIPSFVHEAPKYLIEQFLNGYFAADGCNRTITRRQSNRLTTVSTDLAFSVQRLYYKLGYIGSLCISRREGQIKQFPNGKKYAISDAYTFEIYKEKRRNNYSFIEDGYAWIAIREIECEDVANVDVYNLSVLNDNSYIVNNIAVHNCYGYQWRHFNKSYVPKKQRELSGFKNLSAGNVEGSDGIDQLQQIIDALKDPKQRTSRRLIMTAWNPCQIHQMVLPPCHILCQFNVHDGNKLSCALYQRSCDCGLGVPFNIASYSFLTHLLAKHCGLEAYEFVYFMGNCHIYEEHIESMKLQITREPFDFPTISIKQLRQHINDYEVDDFEIYNYNCHEQIKMKMIA
jgi:thymidylate synthase